MQRTKVETIKPSGNGVPQTLALACNHVARNRHLIHEVRNGDAVMDNDSGMTLLCQHCVNAWTLAGKVNLEPVLVPCEGVID